jgi:nucleoside-diphosphate-sugar epimerase
MEERILVTGSTGFVGRALIASLASKKCKVTAFMRESSAESLIPQGISIVKGELSKMEPLRKILERFDIVIHCAAQMDFAPSNVPALYATNVDGTANLAKAAAAAGVKQFIYISSSETVAPTLGEELADEKSEPNAVFEYGRTKIIAEQEVGYACQNSMMNYTIIRPTGILGAGDVATAHQFFWAVNFGLFFFVPGSSTSPPGRVCYTHISDIVKGITLTIGNPQAYGETFFLTSNPMSFEALIRRSCTELNRIQPFMYLPFGLTRTIIAITAPLWKLVFKQTFLFQPIMIDQMQHNRTYSNQKAQRILGWSPQYSMEDAVSDMIRVQRNTGLLTSYSISPVALTLLALSVLILFYFIFL